MLPRIVLPLLAVATLAIACSPVPPPPADLLQVVDADPNAPQRNAEAARELMEEADAAWERRADPLRLEAAFRDYGRAAVADPDLYDAYWKAGRAATVFGQSLDKGSQRAAVFERGSGIARLGIMVNSERPEARYYYAITLGLWARERRSIGLATVKEIQPILEQVAEDAPELDDGGPLRSLAFLYLRAPEWPTSVGDADLALEWAERAVEQGPSHAVNHLALAEAQVKLGEDGAARESLDRAESLAEEDVWSPAERAEILAEVERLRRKLR